MIFIAYKQSYGIHMCEEDLELVRALANGEGEVVVVILNINIVIIVIIILIIIMWLLKSSTLISLVWDNDNRENNKNDNDDNWDNMIDKKRQGHQGDVFGNLDLWFPCLFLYLCICISVFLICRSRRMHSSSISRKCGCWTISNRKYWLQL